MFHAQLPLRMPCSCFFLVFPRAWTISSSSIALRDGGANVWWELLLLIGPRFSRPSLYGATENHIVDWILYCSDGTTKFWMRLLNFPLLFAPIYSRYFPLFRTTEHAMSKLRFKTEASISFSANVNDCVLRWYPRIIPPSFNALPSSINHTAITSGVRYPWIFLGMIFMTPL